MTPPDLATCHVVDRCPSCGVEHDTRMRDCEACDTPLRPWCRLHGRETGWLDGQACPRCAEKAASAGRPSPPPPAPVLDDVAIPDTPAPAARRGAEVPAHIAARVPDGWVGRTIVLLFMMMMTVGGGAAAGGVLWILYRLVQGASAAGALPVFAVGGGIVGVLFGGYSYGIYLDEQRAMARKP